MMQLPPGSTLFPYTTLFRSVAIRVSWPGESTKLTARRSSVFVPRSEEHTSELQSLTNLVCRLLLGKKQTDEDQLTKVRIKRYDTHDLHPCSQCLIKSCRCLK